MADFSLKAKLTDMGYDVDAFDLGMVSAFETGLAGIAKGAQNEWIRLAQERLGTSREIYINGLRQAESFTVKGSPTSPIFEIQLVGNMPNNFEFGMASFDMKSVRPGWLGGAKAKTAADGSKYVVIPFRHSTGDSARMAYTGKAAAVDPNLKDQLRKAVRDYGLDRMVRTASGKVVEGAVSRIPNKAPVHSYLKGMVRTQKGMDGTTKTGLQKGSSTLTTFRVMSEKSRPDSWIHPGLDAANLLPEVESWVDNQLGNIIETVLSGDF
jgi:hypothetical protein